MNARQPWSLRDPVTTGEALTALDDDLKAIHRLEPFNRKTLDDAYSHAVDLAANAIELRELLREAVIGQD